MTHPSRPSSAQAWPEKSMNESKSNGSSQLMSDDPMSEGYGLLIGPDKGVVVSVAFDALALPR